MSPKKKDKPEVHDDVDISFEAEDVVSEEEGIEAKVKHVRADLKACEAKAQEYLTGWQRAKADFVNARKRDSEEKTLIKEIITRTLLESFLPALDSFEMAIESPHWNTVDSTWKSGMEGVYAQIKCIFDMHGMIVITPQGGDDFNPAAHEAVGTEPAEDYTDGSVARVVQKGYRMNNFVVRPALVILAGE